MLKCKWIVQTQIYDKHAEDMLKSMKVILSYTGVGLELKEDLSYPWISWNMSSIMHSCYVCFIHPSIFCSA